MAGILVSGIRTCLVIGKAPQKNDSLSAAGQRVCDGLNIMPIASENNRPRQRCAGFYPTRRITTSIFRLFAEAAASGYNTG